MQTANPRRWAALGLIALAQFMVIMDTSIIGVALPEIRTDLGFGAGDLSWVFNAYVIAFGGLLLLGGRLSDLLGARRVFTVGWAILAGASLVAGLAETTGVETAARAAQGAGAALIAPSALTLLMMLSSVHPVPRHGYLLGQAGGGRPGRGHRQHELPGRLRARPGRDDGHRHLTRRRPHR